MLMTDSFASAEPTFITDSGTNYSNLPTTPVGLSSAGPGRNLYAAGSGLADSLLAGISVVDQNTAATQAGVTNLSIISPPAIAPTSLPQLIGQEICLLRPLVIPTPIRSHAGHFRETHFLCLMGMNSQKY